MNGSPREYSKRQFTSNEELTQKISHSVFVTNFPDYVNSRDLWEKCSVYGTVVDVFIPSKKSKAGKRFAFVRYDRPHKPSIHKSNVPFVNGMKKVLNNKWEVRPRFVNVKISYLGGLWVMFKLDKVDTKMNMMNHTEVNSWFQAIQDVTQDFVSDKRVVWIDIEGKVFMVRAKELFTWNPSFESHKEKVYSSDDESVQEEELNENRFNLNKEEEGELNGNEDDE
ncbi:RNA-directed DNA polymerase, eukaryota, partial [Tanacetum coccineum]